MEKDIKITAFTDGGARNNGKPHCVAAWAVYFDDLSKYNETDRILIDPSNQKAELYAIKMALKKLTEIVSNQKETTSTSVRIVTDSQYSIDCVTKWCRNWEKNGWRTYKGEHVKHSTIIKDCLAYIAGLEKTMGSKVTFLHVNSHTIPPKNKDSEEYAVWYGNYMADKMVNETMSRPDISKNGRFGKVIRIDWDGAILSETETETETDKSGKIVTVTW